MRWVTAGRLVLACAALAPEAVAAAQRSATFTVSAVVVRAVPAPRLRTASPPLRPAHVAGAARVATAGSPGGKIVFVDGVPPAFVFARHAP